LANRITDEKRFCDAQPPVESCRSWPMPVIQNVWPQPGTCRSVGPHSAGKISYGPDGADGEELPAGRET
jgi:hypothetical protein